jgi:hypothetical protein
MTIIYTDNTLDLTNLKRKPEVEAEYQSLLKVIKNAGSTPSEVIFNKLEGKKLAKVLNEFPYDLGEDLEHWLVWSVEPKNTYIFETPALIWFHDSPFLSQFDENKESIWIGKSSIVALFENTPDKKSVGLTHYHLIVRK